MNFNPDSSPTNDLRLIAAHLHKCAWPTLYYGVVPFLLKGRNPRHVAEIGVAYGFHAHSILLSLPNVNYFGIDPYLPDYDAADIFCAEVSRVLSDPDRASAMNRLGNAVIEGLKVYGARANLIRKKSENAAPDFCEGFFDLVFVDGDHTFEGVMNDLNSWWPKVSDGGVLCGDDYLSFEGVRDALNDFTKKHSLNLKSTEKPGTNYPIWILEKPKSG